MRICVGDWVVDPEDLSLRRGETVRRLEPKVMTLLVRLAESRGEVVRREALFAALWPDVTVGEDTLARVVSKLRRALGDDPKRPVFVETIRARVSSPTVTSGHSAAKRASRRTTSPRDSASRTRSVI
ncbi:MAG: winged helix-turn-helix domain-containing protein, partial [Myxococcota bacterium]